MCSFEWWFVTYLVSVHSPNQLWYIMDNVMQDIIQKKLCLTHYGLVMSYNDIDLGQHWLWWWLVAWWHQAITWTNDDLSVRSSDIRLRAISQEMPQPSVTTISLEISYPNFHSNLPGANKLIRYAFIQEILQKISIMSPPYWAIHWGVRDDRECTSASRVILSGHMAGAIAQLQYNCAAYDVCKWLGTLWPEGHICLCAFCAAYDVCKWLGTLWPEGHICLCAFCAAYDVCKWLGTLWPEGHICLCAFCAAYDVCKWLGTLWPEGHICLCALQCLILIIVQTFKMLARYILLSVYKIPSIIICGRVFSAYPFLSQIL